MVPRRCRLGFLTAPETSHLLSSWLPAVFPPKAQRAGARFFCHPDIVAHHPTGKAKPQRAEHSHFIINKPKIGEEKWHQNRHLNRPNFTCKFSRSGGSLVSARHAIGFSRTALPTPGKKRCESPLLGPKEARTS